ncbi:MAG: hypothetical protein BWY59_01401 [Verrucomicrobia bacterium ADurb.Bin345]|nr:MAG: hypothetical protein BWY59_01401 [Verrucomicrobia bacterium ADurb.Bin345]
MHRLVRLLRGIRALLALAGLLALLALGACFTAIPWRLYSRLAEDPYRLSGEPDYIVLLGGGGVPSESGLTRAFTAAQNARRFDDATVVLALPYDTEIGNSAAGKMRDELILRGVEPDRILIEPKGRNTREQALNVAEMLDADPAEAGVLLVTSPEHMRRALGSFRKAGFGHVAGSASFSEAIEMNLLYDPEELGGRRVPLPDGAGSLMVRYEFWNNLGFLGSAAREWTALAYYWLKGWI